MRAVQERRNKAEAALKRLEPGKSLPRRTTPSGLWVSGLASRMETERRGAVPSQTQSEVGGHSIEGRGDVCFFDTPSPLWNINPPNTPNAYTSEIGGQGHSMGGAVALQGRGAPFWDRVTTPCPLKPCKSVMS